MLRTDQRPTIPLVPNHACVFTLLFAHVGRNVARLAAIRSFAIDAEVRGAPFFATGTHLTVVLLRSFFVFVMSCLELFLRIFVHCSTSYDYANVA